ncbi:MAG: 7-carboxy-7-deazaguanine synthase, partial [Candidatus Pacebacteria bacterium]|nr:7-carboxy-7-deazaguanine synthase [Candidatus Paceibacterota bacterium]
TLPLPDAPRPYHTIMDVKCPSSGEAEHFRKDNVALLQTGDELKFVVAGRRDFGWMLNCIDRLAIDTEKVRVLVAPVYQVCALRDLAEWVLAAQRSNLRLQPQLHRVIWPEVERGR